jgi:acyl-CoA reductase-like NAD-dependent aldehyde dehydrogenase
MVNVNGSMGLSMNGTFGGYKQSGIGREMSGPRSPTST